MIKKLSQCKPGTRATIHSFASNDIFLKLMEMGCIPGEPITIELIAPFGDPMSIMVSGYHLSLRKSEADQILVEIPDPVTTTL